MTKEEIAEARKIIERATPGPWNIQLVDCEETCWLDGEFGKVPPTIHDLNFIDASRTEWPKALDALEAVQAEIERLKEDYQGAMRCCEQLTEAREAVKKMAESLMWIMPKVHQGNHDGPLEGCGKATCIEYRKTFADSLVQKVLGEMNNAS